MKLKKKIIIETTLCHKPVNSYPSADLKIIKRDLSSFIIKKKEVKESAIIYCAFAKHHQGY